MTRYLPTKLAKEPLVDAVFELRFDSRVPASSVLPGALYAALGKENGGIEVKRLPVSEIPESIRSTDAALRFQPVVRLELVKYFVLIGDSSIAVSCKLPYSGWSSFREVILRIVDAVKEIGVVTKLSRYSLKYVDVLPAARLSEQVGALKWNVKIGEHQLRSEIALLRVEIPRSSLLHIVSIQTGVTLSIPGRSEIEGVAVDVDSVANVDDTAFANFIENLSERLDFLHAENKQMFFECLTDETVASLEPSYE